MKKATLIIMMGLLTRMAGWTQSVIGLPAIENHRYTEYHGAIEIWDLTQDRQDLLYAANNDGLLSFDGARWKTYPLPNKATIKSLAIDSAGRIYVGGQDEVGYFAPGPHGVLTYYSLKEKLPPVARQFADIWNIVIMGDQVFFRTIESIFRWRVRPDNGARSGPAPDTHGDTIQTFDAPGGWRMMARAGGRLFAADRTKGLMEFRDDHWIEAVDNTNHPGKAADNTIRPGKTAAPGNQPLQITGILDYRPDTLLVTTVKNGLFTLTGRTLTPLITPADARLKHDLINNAKRIDADRYAICTAAGGLLILDGKGRLIQRFSSAEGLQNNNVLNVYADHADNLWLGLENGLSYIHYHSAVTHIYPVKDNRLRSNAIRIFDDRLYIGTSNGLYSAPLDGGPGRNSPDHTTADLSRSTGAFTEVANTNGNVWSLEEVHHQLMEGHRDGAFVIRNNTAFPIFTGQGVWMIRGMHTPGAAIGDSAVLAATYTGLRWMTYDKGQLKEGPRANDLYESLPAIAVDDSNTVWASQPYRGVFRNNITGPATSFTHYTTHDGLPADVNNKVLSIDGKIVAATLKGVYEYRPGERRFIPSPFFQPIFHDTAVEYLRQDMEGNTWFVSQGRVGVIDVSKPAGATPYTVVFFPELTGATVKGYETIYPYNKENIFIGSSDGVLHLNYNKYIAAGREVRVMLSGVKATAEKDSLLFGGYAAGLATPVRQSNHWNSFHFEYASPSSYAQPGGVEFSYMLEGFDKTWSEWTTRTEKDYTNLPHGKYTFSVKARDNLGSTSAPASFSFIVEPAWYQTIWVWLCYLVLAAGVLLLVRRRQRQRLALHQKRHEEEQARLKYLHGLELDSKEKGLIALQNAKLEGELQFKNKELATVTMHLLERGSLLANIREELTAVIKKLNIPGLPYEFRSVFKMISDTEKDDDDWNRFALHFDQVHNNFLAALKAKYPLLSATDLKLCAYLRLNLSSKEIAQVLNISLKGVEVSRYRIRKKLGLPSETNLYEFLLNITGSR